MSGPKCEEAHPLLSRGWPLSRAFERGVHRGGVFLGGAGEFDGSCSWGQGRRSFGWKHPKVNLPWRKSNFGLEEEEEEDLKRRNGFHLPSSPIFLFFLIFMVVFPPSMS